MKISLLLLKGHSAKIKCMQRLMSLSGGGALIPIEKQIMSALRNLFPVLNRTSQRQNMEKDIWTDFNFNTLLFLCFVVGEQRLQIFVIVRRLVVGEH